MKNQIILEFCDMNSAINEKTYMPHTKIDAKKS